MRPLLFLISAISAATSIFAQQNPEWTRPFPAHRIIGNLYYVGTYDLASYLVVTPQGNILINTGMVDSTPLIKASIESLGFKLEDTKILLATHAHFDHIAAMAEIKRITGAKFLASAADKPLYEDGGASDYVLKDPKFRFPPIKVDAILKDKVILGGTEITVYNHPGHTKGAVSYGLTIDGKRVLIANMGSINPGTVMVGNKMYPQIAADYAATFEKQKKLTVDVFLASHASQYGLHNKWKPGQPYSAETFVDPKGYQAAVASAEAAYRDYLAKK